MVRCKAREGEYPGAYLEIGGWFCRAVVGLLDRISGRSLLCLRDSIPQPAVDAGDTNDGSTLEVGSSSGCTSSAAVLCSLSMILVPSARVGTHPVRRLLVT